MQKPRGEVDHYGFFYELPRPRQVRVNLLAKVVVVALPLASMFQIYSGIQVLRASRQIGMHSPSLDAVFSEFFIPVILLTVSAIILWTVQRDKALLRDGELVAGKVTHQKETRTRRGRKQSSVRYRFSDASGQMFQGTGTDNSRKLGGGMTVPVFYDRKNPERNVAICSAWCELRLD
jgi:hypothetical protein